MTLFATAISTLCSFGALLFLLRWIFSKVDESYRQGVDISRRLELPRQPLLADLPFHGALNDGALLFLPAVEQIRRRRRLGVDVFLDETERKLVRAGLRSRLSPEQFLAFSLLAAAAGGAVLALLGLMFGAGLAGSAVFLFPIGALGGFFMPGLALNNVISNRISLIQKRLPFAIEFMLLSMEARAAFPAAIQIYSAQMPDCPLAEELNIVLRETELGTSIQESLSNFAARLDCDDVSAFVLAVNTGLETGQPIKDVLQVQSDAARERRYQSAEQVAKTASTRATFPLMMVAIAVFLLVLGPLMIRVVQQW